MDSLTPQISPCPRCGAGKRHATDPLCVRCARGDVLPATPPRRTKWWRLFRG